MYTTPPKPCAGLIKHCISQAPLASFVKEETDLNSLTQGHRTGWWQRHEQMPKESLLTLLPSGSKWPAKLTKLEGKPQFSQVLIIIRTPRPIFNFSSALSFTLSLGLHAAYLQNLVRLILRRKQDSFILKTVIIKNKRGRKEKGDRQTAQPWYLIPLTLPRSWRIQLALTSRGALPAESHMDCRRESEADPLLSPSSPFSRAPLPASQTVNCLSLQRVWQPVSHKGHKILPPVWFVKKTKKTKTCFHF